MSHIQPKSPTRPTSRNRPSHWLSRIGAFRSGLSSPVCLVPTPCPRTGLRMPSTSLGRKLARPLRRVGSAASVLCSAIKPSPHPRERTPFTVPMDPGATSLMTIAMGITRGRSGRMSRGRSHRNTTVAAARARIGVREAVAIVPTSVTTVGTDHRIDRDRASATPSGRHIAKRTPSAIG